MSSTPAPTESPIHVEPLHHPAQAAHVVVPQAPLGNATNGLFQQAPGLGAKALLAKKLAKGSNPKFISPTDNLMTPCSQKINAAKRKHFIKADKPIKQLSFTEESEDRQTSDDEPTTVDSDTDKHIDDATCQHSQPTKRADEDENPF